MDQGELSYCSSTDHFRKLADSRKKDRKREAVKDRKGRRCGSLRKIQYTGLNVFSSIYEQLFSLKTVKEKNGNSFFKWGLQVEGSRAGWEGKGTKMN